jgi:acylphosphatase
MGLTGFAANLPDGRVEVHADGPEEALRQFEVMLRRGPTLSRVSAVTSTPIDAGEPFNDFGAR